MAAPDPVYVAPCPELGGRPAWIVHCLDAVIIVGSADGPAAHVHERIARRLAYDLRLGGPYHRPRRPRPRRRPVR